MKDFMLSEYLLSDWGEGGGGGGGDGGGEGCGIMFVLFLICCFMAGTCNNDSKGNTHYLSTSNPQIETVEDAPDP